MIATPFGDELDPIRLRARLDEAEAALGRARAERDMALASLFIVRRVLVGGPGPATLDELLRDVIDPPLQATSGDHPATVRP